MAIQKDVIFVEVSMASSNPELPSSGIKALEVTRKLGYRCVVLAKDPSFYRPIGNKVDQWITCDTGDVNDVINSIKDNKIAAILTFSDLFVGVANKAAYHLGTPSVSNVNCPAIARDKAAVRSALDSSSVPNIRWSSCVLESVPRTSPIGYPCIVKPIDGSSSWDVRRVTNDVEFKAALNSQKARETYGRGVNPKKAAIIEEELIGDFYSVEGFVEGEDVTIWGYNDRILLPPPYYYEVGSTFFKTPPDIHIEKYCHDVLAASGYDFGPFHLELMVTKEKGPQLIELNPRLIGGGAHQCIDYASDANIVENILKRYLHLPYEPIKHKRVSTIYDVYPKSAGEIKDIKNINEIKALNGVKDIIITKKTGDKVKSPTSNSDSLGYIISVGESYDESLEIATKAFEKLEIIIK